jgi:hypothetical protein
MWTHYTVIGYCMESWRTPDGAIPSSLEPRQNNSVVPVLYGVFPFFHGKSAWGAKNRRGNPQLIIFFLFVLVLVFSIHLLVVFSLFQQSDPAEPGDKYETNATPADQNAQLCGPGTCHPAGFGICERQPRHCSRRTCRNH